MREQTDFEIDAVIQRTRHLAATLDASANAFGRMDARDYSDDEINDMFRKISALHASHAEKCRQQVATWLEVEQSRAEELKGREEIKATIERMTAEFNLRHS